MNRPIRIAIVVIIFLLAMGLRISHITDFPLWTDEGWTIWYVETQSPIETIQRLFENRHPPLYFVALSAWQNLAGNSHLSLRILAVFSGLITSAFVYRITADWFKDETALYATLIFAVLDISIYYSQEVRHYSWLTMMVVMTSALFLRYVHRPQRNIGIAYLLSVTGIMLTHYFGLFTMLVQAFFGLVVWKADFKQKRNLILIWLGAFILYIPWMFIVFSTLSAITRGVGNFPGSFSNSFDDFLGMLSLLFDAQFALLGGAYIVGLLSLRKLNLQRFYVVTHGGGLFLIMWILNFRIGVLSARMIYYLTPFLIILCAYGLVQIKPRIRVVLAGAFLFTALISTPIIQPRLSLPEMTAELAEDYAIGDLIVIETGWTDFATEYEIKQAIPESIPDLLATARIWIPDDIRAESASILPTYDTVWVVQWLHAAVVLPELLDGSYGFELVDSFEIENEQDVAVPDPIRVYRFQRPNLEDDPLVFGENIQLHENLFPTVVSGDSLRVDLWWQTSEQLDRDYSVGLFLMDENGQIVTQHDAGLADIPSSQWQAETSIHVTHFVAIPENLPSGDYTLNAVVYYFEDPANPLRVNEAPYVELGIVTINDA